MGDKLRERLRVNTVIKLYTLILLAEGPKHGYEIMKRLEEITGSSVGPSQIYPYLKQLEKAGIIRATSLGPRDKKLYALTDKGREFVRETLEGALALIQAAINIIGREKVC